MCQPWVEGFRKGQSMRSALTLRWIWRQCGAQMGGETSRSGVHREGLWPGLQARGRNDFSICGSLPLCPWGGQSQLLAGIWKKESFSVMCIVGGGYMGARNGVHLFLPWWGECLRGRGLDPVSCLRWQVGWGLGFQGQRWGGGGGEQAQLNTGLILLNLTCPLAEGGAAKFLGAQEVRLVQAYKGPLTLFPADRQTPPSWCDPRTRSTARSFRLVRLLAPHPGPHPSYLPLLFEGAQPTQIYMFVCLPVCLSWSLPIPVAQLLFLSRSFSWSAWSQIHEAGTPVDAEAPAYGPSPAPRWLRTTNPSGQSLPQP